MKIRFQNNLEQIKKVREVVKDMQEAKKLAECVNHWSDDDSWGGSFGASEWTPDRIYNDWFINLKAVAQLVVDEDGTLQGYIDIDHHFEDDDTIYADLLGVCPAAQGKGYGKSLLLSALKKTIEVGKRRLDLHTWAGNLRSVPVYKKTGFFWRENTSVLMENYLPAVLTTPYFEDFFIKNDFYDSREIKITQQHDNFKYLTMQAYYYRFVEDDNNILSVYIDCHAKELSGFSHLKDGKNLTVQLIPNQHEIFLGLGKTTAILQIENKREIPIKIKGDINPYKGIKEISPKTINVNIEPGDKIAIDINAKIDYNCETYNPSQETEKRTDCRFNANLKINGKNCQLGCGWIPKDAIQIKLLKRSLYFGKHTEEVKLPLGFRNLTQEPILGSLSITGKGLTQPHVIDFDLEAYSAMETLVSIIKPSKPISESWKWDLEFKIKKDSNFQSLPLLTTHISCFTMSGAVAYINSKPKKEAIIENEYFRFHFAVGSRTWYALQTIYVKEMNLKLPIQALGVGIGRPFPMDSSEFTLMESPYEIITKENGVVLKQEFLSKIEKPGLKAVRWIELGAGKRFITTYYDLTNTNTEENQVIRNVSIKNVNFRNQPNISTLYGNYIIPAKQGFLVMDDPEFIDEYDFPQKREDFAEPWFACEPHNAQRIGFGVIWNPTEVERIQYMNPYWGPNIETITYDIEPGQTIRTGHYSLVLGQPAVRLTRKIWLEEFNGKAVLNKENNYCKWSQKLLDVSIGEDLKIPDLNQNPFPTITMIDLDTKMVEVNAYYHAKRQIPIDLQVTLSSRIWQESQQIKLKLESGKECKTSLPIKKDVNNREPYIIPIKGTISLPLNSRNYNCITIPYHSEGYTKLEKIKDYWLFSNELMSFKTSETHGASLFSAQVGGNEGLFFSRFPNKDMFIWFKHFVGGFHPLVSVPGKWDNKDFFNNTWTKPKLIKENSWRGLQFSLVSAKNDFRLKNISYTMTYYMRPNSPLIWGILTFTNNSKMTNSIDAGLYLYLQPIESIYHPWNNEFFVGKQTSKRRDVITTVPNNWVIVDWGNNSLKALFASTNPRIRVHGEYSNSNNYSELISNSLFTLAPGESKQLDVILVFSKDLEELKAFKQRQQVVKL